MTGERTTLYKDKQNAKMMGVCAGIADYTGFNALWIRLGVLIFTLCGGAPISLPAYLIAGLLLNQKPAHLYGAPEQQKYWQSVRQSPARTAREVGSQLRDIDRRLADVETYYVSHNPRLSAEIDRLR